MSFKFNITNEKKIFHITLGTTVYYNTELRLTNLAAATAHNAFLVVKKTGSQFEAQLSLGQKKTRRVRYEIYILQMLLGRFPRNRVRF